MNPQSYLNLIREPSVFLSETGVVLYSNPAWKEFILKNDFTFSKEVNFFELLENSFEFHEKSYILNNILRILSGTKDFFEFKYYSRSQASDECYLIAATPVSDPVIKLFVTYKNIADILRNSRNSISELEEVKLISKTISDIIFLYDLKDNYFKFLSDEVYNVLGYTIDESSSIDFSDFFKLVNESDSYKFKNFFRSLSLLNEKEYSEFEFNINSKDGIPILLKVKAAVVERDYLGNPITIFGSAKNYSNKINVIDELHKSEAVLNEVFHIASMGTWELNYKSRKLFFSPEIFNIFEIDQKDGEPDYQTFLSYCDEGNDGALHKKFEMAVRNNMALECDTRIRTARGNRKYISGKCKPLLNEDGEVVKLIGIFRDITPSREAEQKRDEYYKSLTDYKTALDHSAIVAITDIGGKITYSNNTFSEISGYSREELLGKDHRIINSGYHPKEFFQNLWETIQKGQVWKGEIRNVSKSGNYYWVNTTIVPLLNSKGRPESYLSIRFEITEKKKTEQELLLSLQKEEKANLAKDHFISMMSHEIRTPMNAILGLTQLMLEENPRADQEERLKTLKFSADNLLILLNDILDYRKIEEGKINFEEICFNLLDLIENLKRGNEFKTKEKKIEFKTFIDADIPEWISGDSIRLGQILHNLVSNAVKFTHTGYVKLEVHLVSQTNLDIDLDFFVIDTGIGIAKEKQNSIFDRFTQAGKEITRQYGGSGLGLSITKRLLELQNSNITVESEIGKGSKFYFRLKFNKVSSNFNSITEVSTSYYRSLYGTKVLLVEDNEVNRLVATEFLKRWEVFIEHAENGIEALEKLNKERFDLILMDIQMPEMDGYETTKIIRKNQKYKNLPIIALTANATYNSRLKVIEAGMNDFITKPFKPIDLYNAIVKHKFESRNNTRDDMNTINTNEKSENEENLINFNSLYEMYGENFEFIKKFILLCSDAFKKYSDQFKDAMLSRNQEALSKANHKMKPTIKILNIDTIAKEMERSKQLLSSNASDEEIQEIISLVNSLNDKVLRELDSKFQDIQKV